MQVLLLMGTALNMPISMSSTLVVDNLETELRRRHQCIAEITEMIHVSIYNYNYLLFPALFSCDMLYIVQKVTVKCEQMNDFGQLYLLGKVGHVNKTYQLLTFF